MEQNKSYKSASPSEIEFEVVKIAAERPVAVRRKTTTSSAVKRRYNEKVYGRLSAQLPKALVEAFKQKCAQKNVSQAEILKKALEEFVEQ